MTITSLSSTAESMTPELAHRCNALMATSLSDGYNADAETEGVQILVYVCVCREMVSRQLVLNSASYQSLAAIESGLFDDDLRAESLDVAWMRQAARDLLEHAAAA